MEIEMFGKFYHPDYGYAVISTTEPFILYNTDDWPSQGTLLLAGKNGSKAKLVAIDYTTCPVEIDADGDGVYEDDSGDLSWSDYETANNS